jgi:pyridoxine kinase
MGQEEIKVVDFLIKPTLIIQDLSAVGQISLTVATAIFQALDLPIATAPSTLLSTQTEGFGTPVELDTTAWLDRSFRHWQENQLAFNGVLVGYLGTADRIKQLTEWVRNGQRGPVVIDPVMGDSGSLYPGIKSAIIPAMRDLCRQADIITPNLTELRLLTGENELSVHDLLAAAGEMFEAEIVLTGVREGQLVNTYLLATGEKKLTVASSPCYPGHFFGTGDAFSALLTGWYLKGLPLTSAVQRATADLQVAVEQTAALPQSERKFGLQTAALLRHILTES